MRYPETSSPRRAGFAPLLAGLLLVATAAVARSGEPVEELHRYRVVARDIRGERAPSDDRRYVERTHGRARRGFPVGYHPVASRGWNADLPGRIAATLEAASHEDHPTHVRIECPRPAEPSRREARAPRTVETWFGDQPGLNALPRPSPRDSWAPDRVDRLVGRERRENFAEYYPSREEGSSPREVPPDRWEARRDRRGDWRFRDTERRDRFDLGVAASQRGIEFRPGALPADRDGMRGARVPRGDGILRR